MVAQSRDRLPILRCSLINWQGQEAISLPYDPFNASRTMKRDHQVEVGAGPPDERQRALEAVDCTLPFTTLPLGYARFEQGACFSPLGRPFGDPLSTYVPWGHHSHDDHGN